MGMSDLISRQKVIKLIDELGYTNCHNGQDFEANNRVDKIRQAVVEMPTAYDVDGVVNQIIHDKTNGYVHNSRVVEAYKIMKEGGVDG